MREKKPNTKNPRRKILDAALKDFADHGFEGARVDRIAQSAGINKAMIFYYFSSKQSLYRTVIEDALHDFIPQVQTAIMESSNPEHLFESIPTLYIRYFSSHRQVIRMIAREMIHSPDNIVHIIREIFAEFPQTPSRILPEVISKWYRKGLISESDPVHFILNIVPLCLFPIIALPMVEGILEVRITDDAGFMERRIKSISHLLKKGMLL
jgi:TetR/AcrR family transcriptional regulator